MARNSSLSHHGSGFFFERPLEESVEKKNSARSLRSRRLCGELFFRANSPQRRRARWDYAEQKLFFRQTS